MKNTYFFLNIIFFIFSKQDKFNDLISKYEMSVQNVVNQIEKNFQTKCEFECQECSMHTCSPLNEIPFNCNVNFNTKSCQSCRALGMNLVNRSVIYTAPKTFYLNNNVKEMICLTNNIDKIFHENAKNKEFKWQFFWSS